MRAACLIHRCWLVALLAFAPGLMAQGRGIGPFVGALILDGSLEFYDERGVAGGLDRPDIAPMLGLRGGLDLPGRFGLEASYGYAGVDLRVQQPAVGSGLDANRIYSGDAQIAAGTLTYDLLARGQGSLFVGAGLGAFVLRADQLDDRAMADLAANLGAGFVRDVREGLHFRGDVRVHSQFCRQADDRRGVACNDGSVLAHTELTAGLSYRF